MKAKSWLLLGGLSLALGSAAQAAGDPAEGARKAVTCLGCHAIEGYRNAYPSYRVPMIGGQHAEYIVSALQAYKAGLRKHETMRSQAASLSDQDIQDIAAYFAQQANAQQARQ